MGSSVLRASMDPRERKVIKVLQVFQERWFGNTDS